MIVGLNWSHGRKKRNKLITRTSGDLFIRYLLIGLALLACLIVGTRMGLFRSLGDGSALFLASGIIVVTALSVLGYAAAIVRDEELQGDQDAPDMAYYLGFSLTVAALSFTFLSDLIFSTGSRNPEGQSELVSRTLAQFGSGLLATLFGLAAKIFLASKQSTQFADPTALYQQFRREVAEFMSVMKDSGSELRSGIKAACNEIISASKDSSDAVKVLAKQLEDTTNILSKNLKVEDISKPIDNFVNELNNLHLPLQTLSSDFKLLSGLIEQSKTALITMTSASGLNERALTANIDSLGKLAGATLQFSDFTGALQARFAALSDASKSTKDGLLGITKNTNRLSLSIVQATESADNFSTVSKRLSETIGLAMPNLDAHRDAMDLLNATVNQAGISLKGLGRSGDAASNDLTRISATLSELVLQSELATENTRLLSNALAVYSDALVADQLALVNSTTATEDHGRKLLELGGSIERVNDSYVASSGALGSVSETARLLAQQSTLLRLSFSELQRPIDEAAGATRGFNGDLGHLSAEFAKLYDAIRLLAEITADLKNRQNVIP